MPLHFAFIAMFIADQSGLCFAGGVPVTNGTIQGIANGDFTVSPVVSRRHASRLRRAMIVQLLKRSPTSPGRLALCRPSLLGGMPVTAP